LELYKTIVLLKGYYYPVTPLILKRLGVILSPYSSFTLGSLTRRPKSAVAERPRIALVIKAAPGEYAL